MTYLLDTDVIIGYLKGREREITLLKALKPEGLAISLITYGEIYEGIYYGRNPQDNEHGFQQFLRDVSVFPLSKPIMRQFALIRGQLRQTGTLITDNDLLIGATALHHSFIVVTHNIRHFQRIPGLVFY